ncbi:hypothetical protein PF005_g3282 [Phytophthora fragariae]|uniref:RxLR effector protein n=2 Tax=Phytophthora fragariae TaxID=53985 RepID=A0A6A3Z7L1_9STRA|nr:hypothetical protein PF009_g4100 [Phytophthora fragariae]KAE9147123.1 hypothetical protein PF006_g8163 [Phytophthora fragariae]KAE9230903.1 hypothetical protein PF005_g3282 [Phytophthora fragariae]KAE9241448.1 hypothetical protein PF002_g9255 [Phytophthora fragariae]KAE9315745.1 hypothetical protein PF001_g7638 [Phytophthora fragariae]
MRRPTHAAMFPLHFQLGLCLLGLMPPAARVPGSSGCSAALSNSSRLTFHSTTSQTLQPVTL